VWCMCMCDLAGILTTKMDFRTAAVCLAKQTKNGELRLSTVVRNPRCFGGPFHRQRRRGDLFSQRRPCAVYVCMIQLELDDTNSALRTATVCLAKQTENGTWR
jgi:hypothetical protein